jgi:hypothetical protein
MFYALGFDQAAPRDNNQIKDFRGVLALNQPVFADDVGWEASELFKTWKCSR